MLKPKELGEISIKLAKVGEEITVSIMAQNSTTQKLISERLPTLVSSLQEINSQVKDVMIVNPNENTNSFLGQFNLSQSDSREQYQQRQNFSTSNYDNKQVVEEPAQTSKVLIREGQLWQTA
jgi:flagellar hook-length control protein FliK